jgi:hypothetical protein
MEGGSMSDNTTIETKPAQGQKSKRLSSFIWILVMWAALRLVAELDHISWERVFWGWAKFLLAYPTAFLLLSIWCPSRRWEKYFRWNALLVVLVSIVGVYAESRRGAPLFVTYELYIAQALFFLLMVGVALYRWRHGEIQKEDTNV